MILKSFFCLFLVLVISYQSVVVGAASCASKKVVVEEARDCVKGVNPHFRLINYTLTLTNDCHVVPRFCFVWKGKDITTIAVTVDNKEKKTKDFCNDLNSPKNQQKINEMKQPYKAAKNWQLQCPTSEINFEKSVNCIKEGKTDISKYAMYLGMFKGPHQIKLELWDSKNPNEISCIYVKVKIIV